MSARNPTGGASGVPGKLPDRVRVDALLHSDQKGCFQAKRPEKEGLVF